jgi:DNA-binding GntR family transcriptional regulator
VSPADSNDFGSEHEVTTEESPERVARSKEPMGVVVANGLREAIMRGELRADDRIKQDAVSRQFGVSRSPVKEAFLMLESEGFLDLERDVGARVRKLDTRELEELYLAREAIEPQMIAVACERITPEQLAEAVELNERSEVYAAQKDVFHYLEIDHEFHRLLLHAANLKSLSEITDLLWRRTQRYRLEYTAASRLEASVIEHRLILEAFAGKRGQDAADLHRIHARRTRWTLTHGDDADRHPWRL